MGGDPSLPQRDAICTPTQWSAGPNGGFSTAPADALVHPMIIDGEYGCRRVTVAAQREDPGSLLSWFERILRTLHECPETGSGRATVLDATPPQVLAIRFNGATGAVLFLHNLGGQPATVDLGPQPGQEDEPAGRDLRGIKLNPYGYRWIRLARRM